MALNLSPAELSHKVTSKSSPVSDILENSSNSTLLIQLGQITEAQLFQHSSTQFNTVFSTQTTQSIQHSFFNTAQHGLFNTNDTVNSTQFNTVFTTQTTQSICPIQSAEPPKLVVCLIQSRTICLIQSRTSPQKL